MLGHEYLDRGAKILARQNLLSAKEREKLFNARTRFVLEIARDMSLTTLGSLESVNYGTGIGDTFLDSLDKRVSKVKGDERFSLKTVGIFPKDRGSHNTSVGRRQDPPRQNSRYAVHSFWGLTRNGEWILVSVHSLRRRDSRYSDITEVTVEECAPPDLFQRSGYGFSEVFQRLGEVVLDWRDRRQNLLDTAQFYADYIEMENKLLELAGEYFGKLPYTTEA